MPPPRAGLFSWLAPLLLVVLLSAGCASNPERPATHVVKRGDTLYSIAFRHKVDYKDLARWNNIGRDYVIHTGQTLRLTAPGGKTARAAGPSPAGSRAAGPKNPGTVTKAKPPATPSGSRSTPPRQAAIPRGPPVQWRWPAAGGGATLTTRPNGGQGLMITGKLGDEIRAAGSGRVVYTGSGLLGYGQLVIVKHNETYLSAYGHLQSVLVKEGDALAAGQRIATMGNGPQGSPLLYFEIRVNGSPGNPLSLLPQR